MKISWKKNALRICLLLFITTYLVQGKGFLVSDYDTNPPKIGSRALNERIITTNKNFIPHGPLNIRGETALLEAVQTEGWSGNGTVNNPFIISGYNFSGPIDWLNDTSPNKVLLSVGLTDYHIHITNNIFTDYATGISAHRAGNVTIENNTVYSTHIGISIASGTNIHLKNNLFFENSRSMDIHDSSNIFVEDNRIYDSYTGVEIIQSEGILVHKNELRGNLDSIRSVISNNITIISNDVSRSHSKQTGSGIKIEGILRTGSGIISQNYQTLILNNSVNGFWDGIEVSDCNYGGNQINISKNLINVNARGITALNSSRIFIQNNTIFNNERWGVYAETSRSLTIKGNDFIGNRYYLFKPSWLNTDMINENQVKEIRQSAIKDWSASSQIEFKNNFWDDHVIDLNLDGYSDSPYVLNGSLQDDMPYSNPHQHLTSDPNLHIVSIPKILFPLAYESLQGPIEIFWIESKDYPNGHNIVYHISLGVEDQNGSYDPFKVQQWTVLVSDLDYQNATWDTNLIINGWYHLKIEAVCENGHSVFDTSDHAFSIGLDRQRNELRGESASGFSFSFTLILFVGIALSVRVKKRKRKGK
ncbi:MAG: nitrous oxide reductase family maturation protein NosD [Candidatus Thorarchaeota archaeon]